MYGLLVENVVEFIKFKYGDDVWEKIRNKSKVNEYTFVTHKMYSEKLIPRLARAVNEVTGDSAEEFMMEVGYDFPLFLGKYGYDRMLRVLGRSMRDFLNGLDNLHEYLRFSYPKMKPPSFFCSDESVDGLTLHYKSKRKGYTNYVQGQLMRVAKLFYDTDIQVAVLEERERHDTVSVTFRLSFNNKEFLNAKMKEVEEHANDMPSSIPSSIMFDLFPFHVRFDSWMRINGVGAGLKAAMPDLIGKNLTEAFELMRPLVPFTWQTIKFHENCVFDMQSTDLVIRNLDTLIGVSEGVTTQGMKDPAGCPLGFGGNENGDDGDNGGGTKTARNSMVQGPGNLKPSNKIVNDDSSEGEILEDVFQPRRIRLKGQMQFIPLWNSYMFLATPMLPNLDAMFETGLFINDLSMHDSSRDLVLAGTQQSAELKMALDQEMQKSKQLEDSMRKLDHEIKRTDDLLYQMIPRQVADKLRRGEPATDTCEVFQKVSILFSDVVGFTSICSRITPMAVVSLLNGMYTLFDNLTEEYKIYKVETIGDAYMVVGGAPVKTKLHAVRIVEMAFAMLKSIVQLSDPSTGETLSIRVGIHSGVVVAGVVGLKMPRYCLFGDTVNTASRMESTGEKMKIHVSETTRNYVSEFSGYIFEKRGALDIKGKDNMKTYWLKGKDKAAVDHIAAEEAELISDTSDNAMSRENSMGSSVTLKNSLKEASDDTGPNSLTASRRVSLISSAYTPVSCDDTGSMLGSRAGSRASLRASTPNPSYLNTDKKPSLAQANTDTLKYSEPSTGRTKSPTAKTHHKPAVINFGQRDYGHANLQSFMDPAHAHGTMEGAPPNPHSHHTSKDSNPGHLKEAHAPQELHHNNSNGSTPVADKMLIDRPPSPRLIPHDKPQYQTRVQTEDRSTNTNQVPHSSACSLL